MDPATLQEMIAGIKATENVEELEAKILNGEQDKVKEIDIEEKKGADGEKDRTLDLGKSKSMLPPNTVKTYGKRLYSPLAVRPRGK